LKSDDFSRLTESFLTWAKPAVILNLSIGFGGSSYNGTFFLDLDFKFSFNLLE